MSELVFLHKCLLCGGKARGTWKHWYVCEEHAAALRLLEIAREAVETISPPTAPLGVKESTHRS